MQSTTATTVTNKYTVLVVDDDSIVHVLLKATLQKLGFNYRGATSAAAALEMLNEESCDLILSDIEMPDTTGIEFCHQAKAAKRFQDIPLIFLTATSHPQVLTEAYNAGACDYLEKPVLPLELAARATHHIKQREIHRAELEAIEQLNQKNRKINQFLAVASHDLSNPLVCIRGIASQLSSQTFGALTPEQAAVSSNIESSAHKMYSFVNGLLFLSRFNDSLNNEDHRCEELNELIFQSKIQNTKKAKEKKIELSFKRTPLPTYAVISRGVTSAVLDSLISNCLERCPSGSKIEISAEAGEDETIVSVSHKSPEILGITPNRETFESPHTAHDETQNLHSIAHYICEQALYEIGERIWTETTSPRQSVTRFTVKTIRSEWSSKR